MGVVSRWGSALALGVWLGACGSGDSGAGRGTGPSDPVGPSGACPSGCPAGQHCSAQGACTSACVSASECGAGLVCDNTGQCSSPVSSGSGGTTGIDITQGGSSGGGGLPDDGCAQLDAQYNRVIPNVFLLIDQSGSMVEYLAGEGPRWSTVRNLLVGPTGLVQRLQADVAFGLILYTGPDNGQVGGPTPQPTSVCPYLTPNQVLVGVNNFANIEQEYQPVDMPDGWFGSTPTGESLAMVTQALMAWTDPNPKIVILATDGEPTTCADSGTPGTPEARDASLLAAQQAYAAGIVTYVVGIAAADTALQDHLNQLARAGQGQDPATGTAAHYPANSSAELEAALNTIINGERGCIFDLQGTIEGDASSGTVLIDGAPVAYDATNGWHQTSPTQVEFVGTACETLKTGDRQIQMTFPCNVFVPR